MQPASVDNELICNVNYIKHPPRQHLCVSVFNLKRLSLKMSFSIKSLDSIYISCIRVNLCLTQSINHCQGVLCLYLSSFPTPSSSHPCTCYVQRGVFEYHLYTAPSSLAKRHPMEERRPWLGEVCSKGSYWVGERRGGREIPLSCSGRISQGKGLSHLVASFQHVLS